MTQEELDSVTAALEAKRSSVGVKPAAAPAPGSGPAAPIVKSGDEKGAKPGALKRSKDTSEAEKKQKAEERKKRAQQAEQARFQEMVLEVVATKVQELTDTYETRLNELQERVDQLPQFSAQPAWLAASAEELLQDVMTLGGFGDLTPAELRKEGVRERVRHEFPEGKGCLELACYIIRNGRFTEKLLRFVRDHVA